MLKQIINQDEEPNPGDSKSNAPGNPAANNPSPSPRTSSALPAGSRNILSSDVEIKGKLRFDKDLIIDGRIEGEVNSEGDLTVGENAHIIGDIKTRSAVIFGKVEGNITVPDLCVLKQNAQLHGDIAAGKLSIEEGAAFMGSSAVGRPGKPVSSKPDHSSKSGDPVKPANNPTPAPASSTSRAAGGDARRTAGDEQRD